MTETCARRREGQWLPQGRGEGEVPGAKRVKYTVTEGNLILGGERAMQYMCDTLSNCPLETGFYYSASSQ